MCYHPPLTSEANFEKRLIEEGAVTGSLRGSDWLLTGPQWTKPLLLLDGGGRDTSIMSLKSQKVAVAPCFCEVKYKNMEVIRTQNVPFCVPQNCTAFDQCASLLSTTDVILI